MPELDIQISVEDESWPDEAVLAAMAQSTLAAARFLAEEEKQPFPKQPPELSLVFTDDASIREINAEWRGQDKPTNVLSFPLAEPSELEAPDGPGLLLGDVILAAGVCRSEAREKSVPLESHATHLVVHGTLHLLGYDHHDDGSAADMESREVRALARIGIPDPYAGDR